MEHETSTAKKSSRAAYQVAGAATAVAGAVIVALLWFGWEKVEPLLLKPRLEAQWQVLDLTQRSLGDKKNLSDWSAGVFLGATSMARASDRLVGYKLEYVPSDTWLRGTVIEVKSLTLTPKLGRIDAQISLNARKGDLELGLGLVGSVSYRGIVRAPAEKGQDTVYARFRIEPLEIAPVARIGPLQFKAREFWQKLLPDLLVALAHPRLFEIDVPLQDRFKFDLGVDVQATEVVNKETKASISYRVKVPSTVLEERISYAAPVFRPEGIWLLARQSSEGQDSAQPAKPPSTDEQALAAAVAKLEQELTDSTKNFTGDPATVGVWISPKVISDLAKGLATLSDDGRRITIQSLKREGRLAEAKWRDDLLGDGGAYAELVDDTSASAVVDLGKPDISWDASGLRFVMPAKATLKANVHFHFDPLIGGGAGTSIGLNGSGEGTIKVSGRPALLTGADGLKVAALDTNLSCDAIMASVASDGVLKIDLGWINVPKVGAKIVIPLGRYQIGAAALLDSRPVFLEMPADDPRLEADQVEQEARVKKNPWALVPPVPALRLEVMPQSLSADASGVRAFVSFASSPIMVSRKPEAIQKARTEVAAEASAIKEKVSELLKQQRPVQECSGDAEMAILLGSIEIGPRNEIVKFAKNAWNDITKGPGPNNDLRKAVEAIRDVVVPVIPTIKTGQSHGGLGVQIGSWKF